MEISVVTQGVEETSQAFLDLLDKFRKDALTEIAGSVGVIVTDEAQANAPEATAEEHTPKGHSPGTLKRKGIGWMTLKKSSTADSVDVAIGFTRKGFYGLFLELGTSRMSAKPIIVPAYERKKTEVYAMIGDVVGKYVDSWQSAAKSGNLRKSSFSKTYTPS